MDVTTRARRAAGRLKRALAARIAEPEAAAHASVGEDAPPRFYGLTRFSVYSPDSGSWKLTRDQGGSYAEQLYAAERMGPRADIFLELAAPILQVMADKHDYRHFVHYSSVMPDPWQSRLRETARRYPVLRLVDAEKVSAVRVMMRRDLIETGAPDRTVVLFRIDDDDILAASYLDKLSAYAVPGDRGRAVSLCRGAGAIYLDGRIGPLRDQQRVFGAQGQAYVGSWRAADKTLTMTIGRNHTKVARMMPTIADAREVAWLQLRHPAQDMLSDQSDAVAQVQEALAKLAALPPEFDLAADFPTVASRIDPALAPPAPGDNS